jgi:hypothetical protein
MVDRERLSYAAFWTATGLAAWPYLALLYLHGGERPLYCTQWNPWPELPVMAPAVLVFAVSAALRFERRRMLLMLALLAIWPAVFAGCHLAVRIGGHTEFFSPRP